VGFAENHSPRIPSPAKRGEGISFGQLFESKPGSHHITRRVTETPDYFLKKVRIQDTSPIWDSNRYRVTEIRLNPSSVRFHDSNI